MGEVLQQIEVSLGERSYSVLLGYNILPECVTRLREFCREKDVFIVTDTQVEGYYGKVLGELLRKKGYSPYFYVIAPGESSKTWAEAEKILEVMLAKNFSRQVPLLALGGGVVGDLAGFVAALYRRGVPFIQIPTTLLAQVDSSVGGKVAVNHLCGKNMLGTFYQPCAVWADLTTLETLPRREWRAGLGEVLKYALLGDRNLFSYLQEHAPAILARSPAVLPVVIERCLRLKAEIVQKDERDEGMRNFLNLGHTFGHALEKATGFQKYQHGEAVAIGLVAALSLAARLNMISPGEVEEVLRLMQVWELPISFPETILEDVLLFLHDDKKVEKDEVHFVLPVAIGKVKIKSDLPNEIVKVTLKESCCTVQ
ncbi:MAG: 3-dehydroquinate synthase [Clostridia bacterium]|nr:3-dehydroquinate synthase [Clostridia bacterium]